MSDVPSPSPVSREFAPPESQSYESQVDDLLGMLLRPENKALLETYRYEGSTNRVYFVPLDLEGRDFVVVKLLPGRHVLEWKRLKRHLRNLLYREQDISTSGKSVSMELERAREWISEGFHVPPLIESSLPGVRVFKGLHYPTFYTVLSDRTITNERKLEILAAVARDLAWQHRVAYQKDRKGLVHKDPGPWNVMVDLATDTPYWFDLEHPAEYPRMTTEALMVRAVRLFLYGVLDHLSDRFDDVMRVFVQNYAFEPVLRRYVETVGTTKPPLLIGAIQIVRGKRHRLFRSRQIAERIGSLLEWVE